MKRLLIIFFGIIISGFIYSQNYFPMVQENNEWSELIVAVPYPNPWDTTFWTNIYKLSGDTMLSGQLYNKMYWADDEFPLNWTFWGGIREENEKVWHIGINPYPERLIYDFSLSVGDTIWLNEYDPMIVDSIEYKPINNENRKHIFFSYPGYSSITEIWIEGIGSNRGFMQSGSATYIGGRSWFLCKKENGEIIYMNPNFTSCFLTTEIVERSNTLIQINPNPALDKIRISKNDKIQIKSVFLMDLQGNRIREFNKNENELDLTGIPQGFYLLRLTSENGEFLRKIIVK